MKSLILLILSVATLAVQAQTSNLEGKEVKSDFLKTYEGEFENSKYHEKMVIGADGSIARLENRDFGNGIVCNYWLLGMITSVIERSSENRSSYQSYQSSQTHSIYVSYSYVKLNLSKTAASALPKCKASVAQMLSFAMRDKISFRYGAELLGSNMLLINTNLDQLFIRKALSPDSPNVP